MVALAGQGKSLHLGAGRRGAQRNTLRAQGGRYYERFADGSEYVIGHIKVYEPPHKLSFSWQGRDWPPGESLFELNFEEQGEGTLLTLTHSGFEIFGEQADEMVQGNTMGSAEILGIFKDWLEENAVRV